MIIFLPYQFRHWEMYLPLVKPLEEVGIKVIFIAINGLSYKKRHPKGDEIKGLNVRWLNLETI